MQAINNQVPVTAIKFLDNEHLIAGAGSFVKIYLFKKSQQIRSTQIFPIDDVHGINVYNEKAVVWGGRSISLLKSVYDLDVDFRLTCKDRVIDAQIFQSDLYVLTAHNEVLQVNVSTKQVLKTTKCKIGSLLYSGKLFLTDKVQCVGAGTVFNGVIVWDLQTTKITNKLEMHMGSIFDVEFSEDGKFLASCSDDRCVYLSDLEENKPIAAGWGHISRIWRLKFAKNQLISTSEDCSVRVWELRGDELECMSIKTGHQGRNVWSIDFNSDLNLLASGGGDGKIMLWDLDLNHEINEFDIQSTFNCAVRSCCISQNGRIAVSNVNGDIFVDNKLVHQFGSVAIVKFALNKFIAMSMNGHGVLLTEDGTLEKTFDCNFNILDFFLINNNSYLLVPTPPEMNAVLVVGEKEFTLDFNNRTGSPTCAVQCGKDLICVGTRKGDLRLFDFNGNLVKEHQRALGSKMDCVTQLEFENSVILASSRSSEYGYFEVPTLTRLTKTKSRKRGSIEGFANTSSGLLLYGFQKDFFVAWNVTLGSECVSIDCGGSHRSWAVKVLDTSSEIVFTYVRANELYVHRIAYPSKHFENMLVQMGTHGREIRGLEACPTNPKLIATASEDTNIRIGWLKDMQLTSECVIRDGHVSGIQCLHWSPCGKYLLTGAGQAELVVWEVRSQGQVFASEVGRMPTEGIKDQRVMCFSIYDKYIAVGFSDSSFHIYDFNTWELVASDRYRECCLLNIDFVSVNHKLNLLISSTDGHLVIYELDESMKPIFKTKQAIHQSSVRSSCIKQQDNEVYHFSGGDDNSVCGAKLTFNETPKIDILFQNKTAHASAVTSIQLVPNCNKFVSTGSDQKIKIYDFNGSEIEKEFTSVSDTGVMIVDEGYLIVGGIGLEFFTYTLK